MHSNCNLCNEKFVTKAKSTFLFLKLVGGDSIHTPICFCFYVFIFYEYSFCSFSILPSRWSVANLLKFTSTPQQTRTNPSAHHQNTTKWRSSRSILVPQNLGVYTPREQCGSSDKTARREAESELLMRWYGSG